MEDKELEELREEKMKERMQEGQETDESRREELENQVWNQASEHMTPEARERLSNIKVADKEKALAVARQIAMIGESGRVGKVDDEQMKEILKSIGEGEKNDSNIKFRR